MNRLQTYRGGTRHSNIGQKVEIIVEHFRANVAQLPDGHAKAMVVTDSRQAAGMRAARARYSAFPPRPVSSTSRIFEATCSRNNIAASPTAGRPEAKRPGRRARGRS